MKEHPILFKAEMVRALMAGVKTQTRRTNLKTKYAVGDRLWVKETWTLGRIDQGDEPDGFPGKLFISQCADENDLLFRASLREYGVDEDDEVVWKPSLFMSRKQSRLTLEIIALREERLRDITDADALAEGVHSDNPAEQAPYGQYRQLWESINGPGSFDLNPVVKVITFKVVGQS